MNRFHERAIAVLQESFRPRERLNVWQWAEKNVVLSAKVTPTPGPYRTDWCPYVRAPQEDFTNPDVEEIVMCWGTRSSKTETELNCIRYSIAEDPQPCMIAMPSAALAKSISESRLQPSIEDSPVLAAEKPTNSDRYKLLEMHFKRSSLWLVGSNSPANLKSRGVAILVVDEIDTWKHATKKETGALEQIFERTKDRPNRKHLISSTPTIESGQIWKEFKLGDQRYFFVPCPHCGEFQTFKMKNVRWPEEAKVGEEWNMKMVEDGAWYECEKCTGKILDSHKPEMLIRGEWRSTASPKIPRRRSYHLNSIYPVWITFGRIACMFLVSKGDSEKWQKFINSWLAEPYFAFGSDADEDEKLRNIMVSNPAEGVPEGYKALAYFDVQRREFYMRVRAFNKARDSIGLEAACVPGLEEGEMIVKKWGCACVGIDARYHTENVLEWCAMHPGWIPAMGAPGLFAPLRWVKMPIDNGLLKGREIRSLRFRPDDFKEQLHMLRNRKDGEDRIAKWLIENNVSQDYLKQMLGERRAERRGPRGRTIVEFIKVGQNHYYDCEVDLLMLYEAVRAFIFDVPVEQNSPPPLPTAEEIERAQAIARQNQDLWDGTQLSWR